MRIDILTLFPSMMSMFFEESILSRAQKKGHVEVFFHDLHEVRYHSALHAEILKAPYDTFSNSLVIFNYIDLIHFHYSRLDYTT